MNPYRERVQFTTLTDEESTPPNSSSEEDDNTVQGVLSSPTSDYHILSFLGEGSFGEVIKCIKLATKEIVAVKIIKYKELTSHAKNEIQVLEEVRGFDCDKYNFVKFNGTFVDSGNICLEFEMLDMSLWDFVNTTPTYCLTVKEIRPILYQMAITLQLLRSQGLAHSDVKPDNIMLVDHKKYPMKIKMIDFGLACHFSSEHWGKYIQARYYRAPEVILGSPFSAAIDMWSLGCVAAEMFLGQPIFPGNCEYEVLQHMVQIQGQLPQRTLNEGLKTRVFFNRKEDWQWRLKTPLEYGGSNCVQSRFNSLDDLKTLRTPDHLSWEDNVAETDDQDGFVELLKKMLHLNVDERITPSQLLEDQFITMRDFAEIHQNSFYTKASFELMEVCRDSAMQRDEQQPSTSTACQNQDVPPAWLNHQELPVILSISSSVSSTLSIHDKEQPTKRVDDQQVQVPSQPQGPGCFIQEGQHAANQVTSTSMATQSLKKKRKSSGSQLTKRMKITEAPCKLSPTELRAHGKRKFSSASGENNESENLDIKPPKKRSRQESIQTPQANQATGTSTATQSVKRRRTTSGCIRTEERKTEAPCDPQPSPERRVHGKRKFSAVIGENSESENLDIGQLKKRRRPDSIQTPQANQATGTSTAAQSVKRRRTTSGCIRTEERKTEAPCDPQPSPERRVHGKRKFSAVIGENSESENLDIGQLKKRRRPDSIQTPQANQATGTSTATQSVKRRRTTSGCVRTEERKTEAPCDPQPSPERRVHGKRKFSAVIGENSESENLDIGQLKKRRRPDSIQTPQANQATGTSTAAQSVKRRRTTSGCIRTEERKTEAPCDPQPSPERRVHGKRKFSAVIGENSESENLDIGQLKKRRRPDSIQTPQELPETTNEVQAETPSIEVARPHRKRTWATFIKAHCGQRDPDCSSPERKKMNVDLLLEVKVATTEALSSEDGIKPQRKRTWDTFKASHVDPRIPKCHSPVRKKMRMGQDEEETNTTTAVSNPTLQVSSSSTKGGSEGPRDWQASKRRKRKRKSSDEDQPP